MEGHAPLPARPAKSRTKSLLAVLMCVHCSATFFVAVFGLLLAGATAPVIFGVRADIFLVPLLGATLFTGWLWWGKRASQTEGATNVIGPR